MLRPLALLKRYMFLLVLDETFCVRRRKTFTQNKPIRNALRKRWRAEGSPVGQRQKSRCAAAGTIERQQAAAAITNGTCGGVHRGHTCPLCVFLVAFCTSKKPPGAWGRGGPTRFEENGSSLGEEILRSHPPGDRRISPASARCVRTDTSVKRVLKRSFYQSPVYYFKILVFRYWMASARCSGAICSAPSRSAMVRATRRTRSWLRAVRPMRSKAERRSRSPASSSLQ